VYDQARKTQWDDCPSPRCLTGEGREREREVRVEQEEIHTGDWPDVDIEKWKELEQISWLFFILFSDDTYTKFHLILLTT
jgi:hypothetical protein